MDDPTRQRTFYTGRTYRLFTGVFGLFLIAVGAYAALFGVPGLALRLLGGGVLIVLGANMSWAAWRSRESWVSKIGPLP